MQLMPPSFTMSSLVIILQQKKGNERKRDEERGTKEEAKKRIRDETERGRGIRIGEERRTKEKSEWENTEREVKEK